MKLCYENNVEKYVNIGTSFEYGNNKNGIGINSNLNPIGLYGTVKASQSLLVKNLAYKYNLNTLSVKPFTMFGPLENSYKLFPLILNSLKNSKPIKLTHGEQLRDYLHVEDIATFIAKNSASKQMNVYEEILVGSKKSYSLKEFCSLTARLSNYSEDYLLWGEKEYRKDEIFYNYSIKNEVFCIESDLKDSISKTINFYNEIDL